MASVGEVGSPTMQEKLRPHLRDHMGMRAHLPNPDGPLIRPGAPPMPGRTEGSGSGADLRPGDLVSRLLAATPPYLYSLPHPTSFFFSEMLRSLVAAKAGEAPTPQTRRPRKRTWRDTVKPPPPHHPQSHPHPHPPPPPDKPLELTTPRVGLQADDKQPPLAPPPSLSPSVLPPPPMGMPPCGMLPLPSPDATLPPDLLMPPSQPPLWYPPLYPLPPHQPPYPIDPLHFFIDLRVSGHIFDRKSKEGEGGSGGEDPKTSPSVLGSTNSLVRQTKHCSAFSVPQPRCKQPPTCSSPKDPMSPSDNLGPNYVLQNLSRIYDDVRPFGQRRGIFSRSMNHAKLVEEESNNNNISADETKPEVLDEKLSREECGNRSRQGDGDTKEETEEEKKKKKDIRALLGLELVVDYVNQRDVPGKPRRPSSREGRVVSDEDEDDDEVMPTKEEDSDSSPDEDEKRSPSRPRSPRPCTSPVFQPHPGLGLGLGLGLGHGHLAHHFQSAGAAPGAVRAPPPLPPHGLFLRDAPDALNLQVRQ